jgi:aryl-alcohol dehydrogenase-like predicted oxidoreductase
VIAGATKPEQVRANVEAGTWAPELDVLEAINAAAQLPALARSPGSTGACHGRQVGSQDPAKELSHLVER